MLNNVFRGRYVFAASREEVIFLSLPDRYASFHVYTLVAGYRAVHFVDTRVEVHYKAGYLARELTIKFLFYPFSFYLKGMCVCA